MEVAGKVAIVTGASSGIGLATAKLLFSKGAKLASVARSMNKLVALAKELTGSIAVKTDMSKVSEVKRMVKEVLSRFGRVDILVNNAGIGYDALVEKIDVDTFRYVFDLDLVGPVVAIQQVIPSMRNQGGWFHSEC